jgi:DNA-3-methyladenine glycosylase
VRRTRLEKAGDRGKLNSDPTMPHVIAAREMQGKNTVALARWLIGRLLVCAGPEGGEPRRVRIVETEAYHGPHDLACHASRGRTARNAVMFAPGGVWYVYLCYGMHEMLNLVTGPADWPAAVLIRGIAGLNGPGRLTRALGLDRRLNGLPAAVASGLWIEDDGWVVPRRAVHATPRIGVDYAGPVWAGKQWRFVLEGAAPDGTPSQIDPASPLKPRAHHRAPLSRISAEGR